MKILTVDDEFVSRMKAQKILSQYGDCDAASGGKEAIEAFVFAHQDEAPYDLIFMDIQMDDMDGIATLKKIRTHEEVIGISFSDRARVVMLTSADNLQSVMDSYAQECDAYVVKPFDDARIVKAIEETGLSVG